MNLHLRRVLRPLLGTGLLKVAPFFMLVVLVGCAPGSNAAVHTANAQGTIAGFWLGLWQGLVAPILFVVSLFKSDVAIYEIHNSGHWYDFGYLIGVSIVFHGTLRAGSKAGTRSGK